MTKMKGIVMRVEDKHVAVVTEEGDFLRVKMPAKKPLPGDTIEFPVKKKFNFKPYMMIAAMLILIFGISSLRPFTTPPVVASVTIDLTPNIELTIGQGNTVAKTEAQNKEGSELLNEIEIKGLDVYQAVNIITAKAAEMGFLKQEDRNVAIATIVSLSDEDNLDKDKIMQTIHDEIYERKFNGYVIVNEATQQISQQAKEQGIPINRYMLMEKAQQQGSQLTPEFFTNNSLKQVIDDSQIQVQNAFPGDWCEVQGWGGNMNENGMGNQWDDCNYGIPKRPNDNYSNQTNDLNNQAPNMNSNMNNNRNMQQWRMQEGNWNRWSNTCD
ncbi:MAG: anti-sigma factor domain-containing protein [Bacillota bacterium]